MKGITGVVYSDIYQVANLIKPMLDTLRHRKIDGEDSDYASKNVQIGICGGSLFRNMHGMVLAAIDGQVDNYQDLCKEIQNEGYSLTTEKPEEVIVQGYELWGTKLFDKISGSFLVLIFDKEKERLFLVRDRIGKKPLYWYQDQHHFIFASELKAILATGAVSRTPSMEAFSAYLQFGYFPQDMTPIEGINKLLPGHFLQFNANHSIAIQSFWSYSSYFMRKTHSPRNVLAKQLDEKLQSALKRNLPINKPIGCFLSGGLGSSSVAYYLKKNLQENQIKSFTVGYQGQNDEDVHAAQEIAEILKIPSQSELITPQNFLDELVKIAWYLDEPLADPQVIETWSLAKMSEDQTKDVFSGLGSDELLAGHEIYTLEEHQVGLLDQIRQFCHGFVNKVFKPILIHLYKPAALHFLRKSLHNPWLFDYFKKKSLFSEKEISKAAPKLSGLFNPEVFLQKFYNLPATTSNVSSFIYFDVKTRLADLYILQYERLLGAHQLEWHTPFLDRQVVEFLAGLPEPEDLAEKNTAFLLKMILKNIFPNSSLNRPKKTRKIFFKDWIEQSELKEAFLKLSKGALVDAGIISEKWLREKVEDPKQRSENFSLLWSVLALEIWYRLFICHPIGVDPPNIKVMDLLSEN